MSSVYDRIGEELGIGDPLGGNTPADRDFAVGEEMWTVSKQALTDLLKESKATATKEKRDGTRAR